MKVLIVAATFPEIQPFVERFKLKVVQKNHYYLKNGENEVHCFFTGPGILATACELTMHLTAQKYNMVINAGIAGSFNHKFPIGSVVEVVNEIIGDFGIDNNGTFLTAVEAGLQKTDEFPFTHGLLKNMHSSEWFGILPKANGITVNTASGSEQRINMLREKFKPDVETMEGAAFFYACIQHSVEFYEIRAISNWVEPRNKKNWDISKAITNLNSVLINTFAEKLNPET